MPLGIDASGFVRDTLEEIKTQLEARWRAEFGANSDLSTNSPDGQIVGILSDRIAELEEGLEQVYNAFTPDGASGAALDQVCAITGTVRDPATASSVIATATGTPGTVLTVGREASVVDTGKRFATTAPATIVTVTAWSGLETLSVGDRRTNVSKIYQVTVAGGTASSGGPTGNGQDIVDGTVHWRFLGDGTGAVDVATEAIETGPTLALSNTLTTIETPVSGWQGVTNVLDADVGSDVENDAALRIKREEELAKAGAATHDAILAAMLQIDGVIQAVVFQNQTNSTVDGMPPKSVEAVINGGADQDLWDAMFANVAAGIEMYGTENGSSVDLNGDSQPAAFSRPTDLDIYVAVTLIKNPKAYPSDGDLQVKAAIVAMGDAYRFGKNAVSSAIVAACFTVSGVLDVTTAYLDDAPSPTSSATVAVGPRELAVFDTSRISVVSVDGVP